MMHPLGEDKWTVTDIVGRLSPLVTVLVDDSTFANFAGEGEIRPWCRLVLQCEVRYLEMTSEGKLRIPTFRGLVSKLSRAN